MIRITNDNQNWLTVDELIAYHSAKKAGEKKRYSDLAKWRSDGNRSLSEKR